MKPKIIERVVQPLYGQPCWGVSYHSYLNLSMKFGKPSLKIREPYETASKSKAVRRMAASRLVTVNGEWFLWIYLSNWCLSSGDLVMATDLSSDRRMKTAMAQLDGQKLVSVEIKRDTGATRFLFDLGCRLVCFRREPDSDKELWTLYKPTGYVLSVFGDGTFAHQHGSTPDSNKRRQPLET